MRRCLIIASLLAFATPASAQKIIQVVPVKPPAAPQLTQQPQPQQQQISPQQRLNECAAMKDTKEHIACLRAMGFEGRPSDQAIEDCIRQKPQIGMTMAQFENSCWRKMPYDGSHRTTTAAGVLERQGYLNRYRFYFTNGILTAIQD